jgi:hypothetical protein
MDHRAVLLAENEHAPLGGGSLLLRFTILSLTVTS